MRSFNFAIGFFIVLASLTSSAASQCFNLDDKQATRAVHLAKVALARGSTLHLHASQETGIVKPLGIWSEKKTSGDKTFYRVRMDDREVDVSLIYVARTAKDRTAYNLGWMAGCRPSYKQPVSIAND